MKSWDFVVGLGRLNILTCSCLFVAELLFPPLANKPGSLKRRCGLVFFCSKELYATNSRDLNVSYR